MSRLAPDRQQMLHDRWLALVGRWLGHIQGDEWTGSPRELGAALARIATYGERAPRNPGTALHRIEPFIRERGWEMTAGRTGRARYIRFTRLQPGDKTNSR